VVFDGVVAIAAGATGVPGFATYLRVRPEPRAMAEGFALTLELRARIFAATQ
jgi:hypothetical protein